MMITLRVFYSLAVVPLAIAGCGGGAPDASSPGVSAQTQTDACGLLMAAEIETTMGVTPGEPERPNSGIDSCQWPSPDSTVPIVYIGLSQQNIGSWEEYREGMIEAGAGDPDMEGERIDIGRFGHYHEDASMIQVQTQGNGLITLRVRGNRGQIIDLAGKAMARLR